MITVGIIMLILCMAVSAVCRFSVAMAELIVEIVNLIKIVTLKIKRRR